MRNPALVQVLGPLAPFAGGFRGRLEMLGYAAESRVVHLRVMADLSCWLGERGVDASGLSATVAEEFIGDRRSAGHRDARSGRSLRPLLEYLREIGSVPLPVPRQVVGPAEEVLADYAVYLASERGLDGLTVQRDTDLLRPFLTAQAAGGRFDLEMLTAADVAAFMLGRVERVSPGTVQRTGTAMRSLLRFLHVRGLLSGTGGSDVGGGFRALFVPTDLGVCR